MPITSAVQRFWCVLILAYATVAGCASNVIHMPEPFPRATSPHDRQVRVNEKNVAHETIMATALSLRGVPYLNGGISPHGFDCSGFTKYVFEQHRISLPRLTSDQFEVGTIVPADSIVAGDLVFFSTVAPGPSHVGLAINEEQFVHAPSHTGVVRIENLNSRYWANRYIGAKRPPMP